MSDLKAKTHQNRFRLGLCPRPRWTSCGPIPGSWIEGGLLLRKEEGRGGAGKGEGMVEKVMRGEGRGEEGSPPCVGMGPPNG